MRVVRREAAVEAVDDNRSGNSGGGSGDAGYRQQ
jgi:hypothetical protein